MYAIGGRHSGRHAVVTGAGTGIGRAIANRLGAEGASITLLGRDEVRVDAEARAIRERYGVGVFATHCDVREAATVDEAFAAAATALGPIHVLVANAGIGGPNQPGERDRFDDLVATNLVGTYRTLRAAQHHLAPGPDTRHLVVMASVLARFGVAGYTGYCASKAGLLGLVKALALEVASDEVQVNAVCPGWVDTAMSRKGIAAMAEGIGVTPDKARQIAMKQVPMGRMSAAEDVAGLVAWLVSSDARGVTGQALDMNGGAWMG